MWQLDHKEGWALKNWCFWTVVLEKTLESPLDCKEVKPVNPKGNQSWIFIGRTDAEAPIPWPPDAKNSFWKRFWCWERLKAGEGDDRGWDGWMASPTGWIWAWVEQAQGVEDGQGSPACYSPLGRKESDRAERLNNWTELRIHKMLLTRHSHHYQYKTKWLSVITIMFLKHGTRHHLPTTVSSRQQPKK